MSHILSDGAGGPPACPLSCLFYHTFPPEKTQNRVSIMQTVFSPIQVGSLPLKNRIARSATHDNMGGSRGQITPAEAALYDTLARGDVGLLFSAHAYVMEAGKASPTQNGLDTDANLPILGRIAQSVHKQGAKMVMQLNHAGAKAVASAPLGPDGMTAQDLDALRRAFTAAALRI